MAFIRNAVNRAVQLQLFKPEGDSPGSLGSMTKLGYPPYFVTLLGIAKVLGVVALLIPKFPLLKNGLMRAFSL
jgi:uncharacterized membrane protein YphA (DoxX/SURF4 family)